MKLPRGGDFGGKLRDERGRDLFCSLASLPGPVPFTNCYDGTNLPRLGFFFPFSQKSAKIVTKPDRG